MRLPPPPPGPSKVCVLLVFTAPRFCPGHIQILPAREPSGHLIAERGSCNSVCLGAASVMRWTYCARACRSGSTLGVPSFCTRTTSPVATTLSVPADRTAWESALTQQQKYLKEEKRQPAQDPVAACCVPAPRRTGGSPPPSPYGKDGGRKTILGPLWSLKSEKKTSEEKTVQDGRSTARALVVHVRDDCDAHVALDLRR